MAKEVRLDIVTGANGWGHLAGLGFILLPVIELGLYLNLAPIDLSEGPIQPVTLGFGLLAFLHVATIPGMIFGRTMKGKIDIVEIPD